MNSLQEALNQRKSKIEKAVTTRAMRDAPSKRKRKASNSARKESRQAVRTPGSSAVIFARQTHHLHRLKSSTRNWHLLVAEEKIDGATGQTLLHEAISDLFVKKGKKALQAPQ